MLNFILGRSGCGKSHLLIEKINEAVLLKKKVYVIVPEQFSFEFDKKLYNKLGALKFNSVNSLTFTTLAKEIFEKHGCRSGKYADDIAKQIIMYQALEELKASNALMYYGKQANKYGFIKDALKLITEFRQSGITSDDLVYKLSGSDLTLREKLMDVSSIYFTYDRILNEKNLKDSLTDISESAAIANLNEDFKDAYVFFDEFESFTGDEYEMIDTIMSQAKNVCASLRMEDVTDIGFTVFESVQKTWKGLSYIAEKYNVKIDKILLKNDYKYKYGDLEHLNRNILRIEREKYEKSENILIVESRDLYEEADFICAEIKRLVQEENINYNDIIVTSRQLLDYSYIFEAAFNKYSIPYFMHVNKTVLHTSLMQLIIGILEIISDEYPSSENIFKYLKTGLTGINPDIIAELENYCFEWNISGQLWLESFRSIGDKKYLEEARKNIIEPIISLKNQCNNTDAKTICSALYKFISSNNIKNSFTAVINNFITNDLIYVAKELKRLWAILIDIFDSIALVCDDKVLTIQKFSELFTAMLGQITYSVPPQTLDNVKIVQAETARYDSPKIVFISGANESIFPMTIKEKGLLNEKDRTEFENCGIRISRKKEELAADEKLIVYKAVSAPSEKLYLLYSMSDSKGMNRYPSYILKQIEAMYKNKIKIYTVDMGLLFYSSTPAAAYYNYVQNFGDNTTETSSIRAVLMQDDFYRAKLEYLDKVSKTGDFTINDVSVIKKLYTNRLILSATNIEEYNKCHFKFFCKTGLKLKTIKRREIDALEQGSLIHKCLEAVFESCKSKAEFTCLNKNVISQILIECSNNYLEENLGGYQGKDNRFKINYNKIISNVTDVILHLQNELKQSEFYPLGMEIEICDQENKEFTLKTSKGIEVIIKGSVDRADVYEKDGKRFIRVIDYKSGSKKFSMGDILYGIGMQMIIYLFTLTDENGKFPDTIPAGVLYMPSGEIGCGRERDSEEHIEKYIDQHYKMNGVVLNERNVLNAMDRGIQGIYIPAKVLKNDNGESDTVQLNPHSSYLDLKQFKSLKKYTFKLIEDMTEELFNGNISADPLKSDLFVCDYCDYWSVCGNVPCKQFRSMEREANNIMINKLSEEESI